MRTFDTVIIGGGPGGARAARILAKAGRSTAVVSPLLGGECLNFGCIPTKTYLWTAELFERIKESGALFGIESSGTHLNWEAMKQRKNDVVSKLKKQLTFAVERSGATILDGWAQFKDAHHLSIKNEAGLEEIIEAQNIIIATGSEPVILPDFPLSDRVATNHEILNLQNVPASLLIIGGGAIGLEFASIFNILGTQVTIAESRDRLLPNEDPDVGAEVEKIFVRKKITILKNKVITPAEAAPFEKILVAVGRRPTFAGLGIEALGIATTPRGITTNEHMQTSVPHIYAIGDVAGKALLAYTAEWEAKLAAESILQKNPAPLIYSTVPNTIFCLPEVASVGINEEQARTQGADYVVGKSAHSANAKALIMAGRDGFAKVIVERNTHTILGMHMIGEKASELIAACAVALANGMTLENFMKTIFSHPVLSEILKEACEEALASFEK